jgi:general stress protein YciG
MGCASASSSGDIHMAENQTRSKTKRGFASMDPQRQREIASQGGRAAHEQGVAHEFSPEEARAAGRKGGETVSQNREHMSEIGRKGGEASGGSRSRRGSSNTNDGNRHNGENTMEQGDGVENRQLSNEREQVQSGSDMNQ